MAGYIGGSQPVAFITDSIDVTSIGTDAVDTDEIKANAVTASEIAANAVTNVKLADNAVNSAEIAAGAVDLSHLSASGIASSKFLKGDNTWADVDALPTQSSQSGKFLTTDGSDASWATLNTDSNTTTKGLYEMKNVISANYSIASTYNAVTAGPITINNGISVTVPSGSTWVII